MRHLLVLLLSVAYCHAATLRAGCTININSGLPDPQPLILEPTGSNDGFGFILPDSNGLVAVAVNAKVLLSCTGSSNYFTELGTGVNEVTATCVDATTWSIGGTSYDFVKLTCKSNADHVAQRSGGSCYNGGALVDIGFQLSSRFMKLIEVCFSDDTLDAVWSKYDLVKSIGGNQVGFPRPSTFAAAGYYPGLNPDTQYSKATQRDSVAALLGSTTLADQYISQTTDYYLARGHLTANADFVYGSQKRSTFYFINVAPQWQTLNAGNWNTMEDNVKTYADTRALDLVVYTGIHGEMKLPDVAGKATSIFLYQDANNNGQITVPAVYWKVVYDPASKKGVALVAVNNPHVAYADLDADYLLCADLSSQISWLTWKPNDQKQGFGYVCDVNAFRQKVPSLPSFTVSGLLT